MRTNEQPEDSRNIPLVIMAAVFTPIMRLAMLGLPKEDAR